MLTEDPIAASEAAHALRLWRHWQKGCLAAAAPDPSEAILDLVLWVDSEVAELAEDQRPRLPVK